MTYRGISGHQFQNKMDRASDLPATGYLVIRADQIPHSPGRIYDTKTEAQVRAKELVAQTGRRFAVIQIVGIMEAVTPAVATRWVTK